MPTPALDASSLIGGRIQRITQPLPHVLLLELYTGRARSLWCSAHPQHGGVFEASPRLPNPMRPPVFCLWLRKCLLNATLTEVQWPHPQVLELTWTLPTPKGPEHFFLVWEDNGPRSNWLLLNSARQLQMALFNPNQTHRKLAQGKPYALPERWTAPASGVWELEVQEESDFAHNTEKEKWTRRLKQLHRHWKRMLENQRQDAVQAAQAHEVRRRADLLKTALGRIEPGQQQVQVTDFYDPELPEVTLTLDPEWTPQALVNRWYQRADKLEKSVPHVEERRQKTEEQLACLVQLREQLAAIHGVPDLEAWQAELPEWLLHQADRLEQRRPQQAKAPETSEPLTRISSDGLEIWVGRNARENEQVTFRWARGNDWWFHVQGVGGAHVVVHTGQRELPPRTLEEAALLAAHYSKLRLEHAVEVDYTRRKFVKKIRGGAPGRVTFTQNQSILIAMEAARLREVLSRLP